MTLSSVRRLCPRCQAANELEATCCRACGARLDRQLVVRQVAGVTLPAIGRREVGATVALTAAAVAMQMGRRWLWRWLSGRRTTPAAAPTSNRAVATASAPASAPAVVITRRTWWHISRSDGASQWGSQQDTWQIESPGSAHPNE